jgi:hypothetical protein
MLAISLLFRLIDIGPSTQKDGACIKLAGAEEGVALRDVAALSLYRMHASRGSIAPQSALPADLSARSLIRWLE